MGQGLYDLLGWGVMDPPNPVDANGYGMTLEEILPLFYARQIAISYETEPPWLAIALAVSDPVLQNAWTLPPLPDWTPRIAPRRVRVVEAPAPFDVPPAVQARWRDIQAIYLRAGLRLPDAQLLLLSDWD